MEHTKGELEIITAKYGLHKLCQKSDIKHTDILEEVVSEQAFVNLDEIARRWNCHDDLLGELKIMTGRCEKFNWNASLPQTKEIDLQIETAKQAITNAEHKAGSH